MNGCAPGLALIERLEAARKWTINLQIEVFQSIGALDLLTLSRFVYVNIRERKAVTCEQSPSMCGMPLSKSNETRRIVKLTHLNQIVEREKASVTAMGHLQIFYKCFTNTLHHISK